MPCFTHYVAPFALFLLLAGCARLSAPTQRPEPTVRPSDETAYYVEKRPTDFGRKRLLPDPINGLGYTNDPNIRVTDIRQTPGYTVLYMAFSHQGRDTYGSVSAISIQPDAQLRTRDGQQFRLLKAEGIPFGPQSLEVKGPQPVDFRLYFERLPDNVAEFAMYECADEPGRTCWNITGMRLHAAEDDAK